MSKIEFDNCPKCGGDFLVYTYEGSEQYLSCVKCPWRNLVKKSVSPTPGNAKKRVLEQSKKRPTASSRSDQGSLHYDFVVGTQPPVFSFVRCTNLRCGKLTHVHKRTEKCPWCYKLGQAEQISFTEFTRRHHEAYNRKIGMLNEREQHLLRPLFRLVIFALISFGIFSMCTSDRNQYWGAFDNPAFDAR